MKRIAPAAALAVVAAVGILIALLTAQPPGVTLRYDARPTAPVKVAQGACYPLSVLPDDTRFVRLQSSTEATVPTSVTIQADGVAPIASGGPARRGPGGAYVEYRLDRHSVGDHAGAQVCMKTPRAGASVYGLGERPTISLLGAPRGNWLSALPLLSERAAFGRGTFLETATLPLALLLVIAAWIVAVREMSGPGRRSERVGRRSLVAVGVVGTLFCSAFALTTPPFQSPDEMVHLQYAELLADQHALPQTTKQLGDITSPQGQLALGAFVGVAFSPDRRPPWTRLQDEGLDRNLKALPSGGAVDSFTNASSQPPAYYAIAAVGQSVVGGSILDRLLIGRLISALLFGLGAAGMVAFAREAVPRAGGLAIAGGLLVASLPMFGFVGGSMNPDALLVAVSAWTFAVLATILRRGPTVRRGVALGLLIGLGLFTKLIFAGLLPGVAVAAVVVAVRGFRGGALRPALLTIGAAGLAAAAVAAPYLGWAVLSGRGVAFGVPGPPAPAISMRETLVYSVELFVGRFGPIADRIPESGPWDIWLAGLTGRLGWLEYGVSSRWVHALAAFWGALALLAVVGIVRAARARRAVPVDVLAYAASVAGLALLIARAGLTARLGGAVGFEQARYLLPVAAVGAAGVALGLRQLPREALRNWAAAFVVVVGLIDGTALYLVTVGRYFA